MNINMLSMVVLASIVIVIVPGPTVIVVIANSLRSGGHAGLCMDAT